MYVYVNFIAVNTIYLVIKYSFTIIHISQVLLNLSKCSRARVEMARLQFISILCTSFIINQVIAQSTTPLCLLCPCNSEPGNPPSINCVRIKIDNIYDNSYWFDNSNASYSIESLTFKYNNFKVLKTPFPPSDLRLLDISNNAIREIGTGVFSGLQAMEVLILGSNDIERIHPDVFRGVYNKNEYFPLKSLKTLDLKNNKLHTLHSDTFEHIDEVEVLILNNNPFRVIDDQTSNAIASLVFLRVLDLSHTQIKNLPDYFLHTPKYLRILNLSGNNFVAIPKTLVVSHALETLYFNDNPIQNLSGSNVFPKVSTLKVLYMSQMPLLEEVGPQALSELHSLEELHLSNNKKLYHVHPDAFLRRDESNELWLPLTKIFMQYNNISYLDKRTLLHFDKLKELDLRGNPWTCDCVNQWLVDDLVPLYTQINEIQVQQLECENPIEMEGLTLYELHHRKSVMRCLDLYGNRPEQDAFLLIGALSGVLTGVVLLMLLIYFYRSKKSNHRFVIGSASSHPYYSRV